MQELVRATAETCWRTAAAGAERQANLVRLATLRPEEAALMAASGVSAGGMQALAEAGISIQSLYK